LEEETSEVDLNKYKAWHQNNILSDTSS